MTDITGSDVWKKLLQHRDTIKQHHLRDWFREDAQRYSDFSFEVHGMLADFSRQRVDRKALSLLQELAQTAQVEAWRDRMFCGEKINVSEGRAALHPALRCQEGEAGIASDPEVVLSVLGMRKNMRRFSDDIREGVWCGFSGERIRDVVNIGIGGSDLGPKMAVKALGALRHPELKNHFVSNVDSATLLPLLKTLDPATTLFVIASKSFTTQETMLNAKVACEWACQHSGMERTLILQRHFVGVTAQPQRAEMFGLPIENIFLIWDWVGGRYSVWSAVGLTLALAIGMDRFEAMLAGAKAMDRHFLEAPIEHNLPVMLALIGIWNTNFLGAETSAVLPYNESLRYLPAYLQQLEMESNGKTVSRNGKPLKCQANPIVWGEIGSNGQHAFFQLLHQGGWLIPCDFIVSAQCEYPGAKHQAPLLANCFAQAAALAFGKSDAEARVELESEGLPKEEIERLLPHKVFSGNQPSTMLLLPKIDPHYLGMLLALYEHKVFVQGVIWGVNSFDQWGVELGKQLARDLLSVLTDTGREVELDVSTEAYISWCKKHGFQ